MSRHMGKHVPGNPTIIVQNQPGAGGLLAVNYASKVAPQDGTFLTLVGVGLFMHQATGLPGLEVSLGDMKWIGNFAVITNVLATWPTSKFKTIGDATKDTALLGSVGAGSIDAQLPAAFNALLGTRFKVLTGFPGSKDVMLATQRGEVEGKVNSWTAFKAEVAKETLPNLNVLLQVGLSKNPELPQVPLMIELVQGDARKEAISRFLALSMEVSRGLAAPPGVPNERVDILRRGFDAMMKDPEFIADVQKIAYEVNPTSGKEVQTAVEQFLKSPKEVVDQTSAILKTPAE